ncbi:hypothetical protein [Myxococcus vastator]|uniref:hypothetical protein n=1 Tax=Myxococcus vastator TaxID=2709664 RepID=UPI0013D06342|nr:hypothetical protein [Myxococcus vastator]
MILSLLQFRFACVGVLSFCLVGCSEKAAVERAAPTAQPEVSNAVLADHQFTQAKQRTKALGERCAAGGESDCVSRLCLRAGPRLDQDYFCSQQCLEDEACPKEWRCIQIHPSAGGQVCMPPEGWTGAVAEPR